jgi:hypothetical protein
MRVCRLIRSETLPIFQERLTVHFQPLRLRLLQQRRAIQGYSTDIADIAPIMTWARHFRFPAGYGTYSAHPILAGCHGLRAITVPVNLTPSWSGLQEAELCQHMADKVSAAITMYTGLGERVIYAEGMAARRPAARLPDRIVRALTAHRRQRTDRP